MFPDVNKKLERTEYFLKNLKTLADAANGFSYIEKAKQQEMRANLDGFFFEIISAKDFFLQGINDDYKLGLKKTEATDINQLITKLIERGLDKVVTLMASLKTLLNDEDKESWLWRLKNYRNSATHRELLPLGHKVILTLPPDLLDKVKQGKAKLKPIFEGENREISPNVQRFEVPRENIKTYLFKDPEDPTKGNLDIEVIPYCEQSLADMKKLLEDLYAELGLE